MPALRMTSLRLDVDLLAGLRQVKAREGIPVTEQVRRAIRAWLEQHRGTTSKDRRRSSGPKGGS